MRTSYLVGSIGFALVAVTVCCGCGVQKDHAEDPRVVARINDYELTVSDFKSEARLLKGNKSLSADPARRKQELLQEMIDKKVLIQEAQKLNFDKQKSFMKEIERYWEQALLKLLLKKKADEFYRSVEISPAEIRAQYDKMKERIFAEVTVLDDAGAAKKLAAAGPDLEALKMSLKEHMVSTPEPDWWTAGDLPEDLEAVLYSLAPGQVSAPLPYDGDWAVIRVLRTEDVGLEPLSAMSSAISAELLEKKKTKALQQWMDQTRKHAAVKVDTRVLDEISL